MKILKRITLIIFALIIWSTIIGYAFIQGYILKPIASGDDPQAFISAVETKTENEFVGNLSMALIEDGKVVEYFFYSADEPISKRIVFQVASVSKWVTSFGVMKLVEEGKVDLDQPVDDYLTRWNLPESKFDNNQVTVRRLLSHSSRLIDGLGYEGFGPSEEVQSLEESLTKAADGFYSEGVAKVGYEPGSQYMYSGAAYTLLQLLIEEVSGESFSDYMQQTVFDPLGMTNSTFDLSKKSNLDLAQLYKTDGTISPPYKFTALAAASLYTSVEDLTKFMMASIEQNPVLSTATMN